ncbi:MAG: CoA ester lyase [Hyphomicrobiales bacterium]|nr:CoA ester lyase [Hyphomicrobiales bacterium]PCH51096.1 MAG: CoA ester lyase [Hyphomicrobiales bacterium]PCH51371.1 MAG: CoA ester lyase [Hyphomicrobiales bacterium]
MVFFPENISKYTWHRSALFMPASNKRALEKSKKLNADCYIFDLEDSILDKHRDEAHQNLIDLFSNHDFKNIQTVIRTSKFNSSGFEADLKIANACNPDAILLPKVSSPNTLYEVVQKTNINLWAMIETPLALMNLNDICKSTDRLKCLVVGPNDLAKETGSANNRQIQMPWMMNIIAAARGFNLTVLDGVYNNFNDLDGFKADCFEATQMGFDGRTLIHPKQIDTANTAFGPSDQEISKAKAIVAAFSLDENKDKGAIQIDGEMIERLHLAQAEQLLKITSKLSS